MDTQHPNFFDKRPKRRKDKDNPYELFTVGFGTPDPLYFIRFRDGQGVEHMLDIGKELFDAFDQFELDDIAYMHKVDRHFERSSLSDETLNERALHLPESIEEDVSRKIEFEHLRDLIASLPATQRRRLILYYFGGCTYERIAEMEGCTKRAVKFSVDIALKKIKEKM